MKQEEEFDFDKETEGIYDDQALINGLKLKLSEACDGKYLSLSKLAKRMSITKDTLYGILVMLIKNDATSVLIKPTNSNPNDNTYKIAMSGDEFVKGMKEEIDFLKEQIKIREQKIEGFGV